MLSPFELFNRMITAIENTKTCSYSFVGEDRIDEELKYSELLVRLQPKPLKAYIYSIKPNPGTKALFVEGENNNKILIDPNSFPYINLNFSPYHSIMRSQHHFTLYETGFEYVKTVMLYYYQKDSAAFVKALSGGNEVTYKNSNYYQVNVDQPGFAYVKYTVLPGENLVTIAKKLFVNDDMIRLANPVIDGFDDVKAGQVIRVPNGFAKKVIFLLDKTNFLPLVQEMYDEKGLYGRYTFSSFIWNPVFSPDEFTKGKKEYGF